MADERAGRIKKVDRSWVGECALCGATTEFAANPDHVAEELANHLLRHHVLRDEPVFGGKATGR